MSDVSRRALFGLLGAGLVTALGVEAASAQPMPGPGPGPGPYPGHRPPPPPPPAERRPRRPSRFHVWVPGHWTWRRGRWVWVVGHWSRCFPT